MKLGTIGFIASAIIGIAILGNINDVESLKIIAIFNFILLYLLTYIMDEYRKLVTEYEDLVKDMLKKLKELANEM